MNSKEALEASKHDPEGVIKVLEGLEWECLECKGTGETVIKRGLQDHHERCIWCRGLGRLHYSHTPQVGEWYLNPQGEVHCIGEDIDLKNPLVQEDFKRRLILILEWEVIEEILEKAGYWLEISKPLDIVDSIKLFSTS